jgi:hypothetical protein
MLKTQINNEMKKLLFLSSFMLMHLVSQACEVCKKQQPRALRGITHGAGPQSNSEYIIVGFMVIIVLASLFLFIKRILQPQNNESADTHIKHSILNLD